MLSTEIGTKTFVTSIAISCSGPLTRCFLSGLDLLLRSFAFSSLLLLLLKKNLACSLPSSVAGLRATAGSRPGSLILTPGLGLDSHTGSLPDLSVMHVFGVLHQLNLCPLISRQRDLGIRPAWGVLSMICGARPLQF